MNYLMMMIGKLGGLTLLEKSCATDAYSKEDLMYVADVLKLYGGLSNPVIITKFQICCLRFLHRSIIGMPLENKKNGKRILHI